jgi:hypothetical protein
MERDTYVTATRRKVHRGVLALRYVHSVLTLLSLNLPGGLGAVRINIWTKEGNVRVRDSS